MQISVDRNETFRKVYVIMFIFLYGTNFFNYVFQENHYNLFSIMRKCHDVQSVRHVHMVSFNIDLTGVSFD